MTNTASAGGVPRWTIGDRMRKARLYAGMTPAEMAEDIGRTPHTIGNYENGKTKAPLLVLRQYAIRTGVPLEWIQYGTIDGHTPLSGTTVGELYKILVAA